MPSKCPNCGENAVVSQQSNALENPLRAFVCLKCGHGHTPLRMSLDDANRLISAVRAHEEEEESRVRDLVIEDGLRIRKQIESRAPKTLY